MSLEKKNVSESRELEQYRISWKDQDTGDIRHGEFMDKEVLEAQLEKQKKQMSKIQYWIESESEATPLSQQN